MSFQFCPIYLNVCLYIHVYILNNKLTLATTFLQCALRNNNHVGRSNNSIKAFSSNSKLSNSKVPFNKLI
ncbi:unnamed protein product [Heterobilharzia americana]|nr:unnamed protein product [Heterobilharzia americana]